MTLSDEASKDATQRIKHRLEEKTRQMESSLMEDCGLEQDEAVVMKLLLLAQEAYFDLPQQHPSEPHEWEFAMHQLQGLLGIRVLRRDYPEGWPTREFT